MEALRRDLLEHKENVEANFSGGKIGYNELPVKAQTPSAKLPVKAQTPSAKLPYSTPKCVKVGSKSSSTTKKTRRALGDISNQHRTPTTSKITTDFSNKSLQKPKFKANAKPVVSSAKKVATTSLRASVESKQSQPSGADEADDIEFAYGGLSYHGPDPAYLEQLREEVVSELLDDKKPTIMDQYAIKKSGTEWRPEIDLLISGNAPSAWWSSESPGESCLVDTIVWSESSDSLILDISSHEPDECNQLSSDESDDLLDEILRVEIPLTVE